MKLVILSGLSGSGKSVVLNTLEDEGYYCVDNLPLSLLPHFTQELRTHSQNYYDRVAVSVDARANLEEIQQFPKILRDLKARSVEVSVVYLYASNECLLKRFNETRRKHPLTRFNHPLFEAIEYERDVLSIIEHLADVDIDSSEMKSSELKKLIQKHFGQGSGTSQYKLALLFQSFGFKHGLPSDTSFVFDVRCLPNPHWEPNLRPLTGKDQAVQDFLESQEDVQKMIADIQDFIENWLPKYEAENRRYMTISIGCTGGQHRSVYIAEMLCKHFKLNRNNVSIRHREMQ